MSRLDPTPWPLPQELPRTLPAAAIAYASAGIPVFPCAPGRKVPLTTHGFHGATTDFAQIRSWWRWQPEANIGIPTGQGVEVLDVDVHALGTGFTQLGELRRAGLIAGWGQAVRSPSGGLHLYYPAAPGREQRSWSRGTAHLDFRGTGGYIIAPPSTITHHSGEAARYAVIARGRTPRPIDADAIRDRITPPPAPSKATPLHHSVQRVERLASWVAGLPEGNRNAGLFWAACRLAEAGLSEPETHAILEPAARITGLGVREVVSTIRSAHRTASLAADPVEAPPRGVPLRVGR